MSKSKKNYLGLDNSIVGTKGRGIVEDSTEYGEFIATFDAWMTPEEQKRRANYLENLTRQDEHQYRDEKH